MPILTKAQLEALNQSSFPDNTTGAITPQILRDYNTSTIDTLVDSLDTGSFIQDLTSLNTFTASQQILNAQFADTGSNTFNGNQVVVGAVTASTLQVAGLDYPTADNGAKSFLQTDGAGNLSFQYVNSILEEVRYGENITIGDPLYVSGSNGTRPIVWRARAADTNKMPVIYIATSTATANTNTTAIALGNIEGVTTTGYPAGTTVYVGEAGGWSANRPSGSASIVQPLGIVTKEAAGGGGRGLVLNPGPAFLPNLQTGYAWVGDGGNQPTAVPTSSFGGGGSIVGYATTGSNTFVGNQTISNDGDKNGIFFRSGSEFFVGQRSNGNFSISSSAENRIIDINPSSGWVEHYTQNNFNQNVSLRGTTDARNINTTTGLGFVAQFDGFTASLQEGYAWVGKSDGTSISVPTSSFGGGSATWPVSGTPSGLVSGSSQLTASYDQRYALSGSGGSTINTGSFATTGSNTFTAGQTILGGINLQGNIEGSGSAYTGVTATVDVDTDPTNVYSAFQLIKPGGDSLIAIAANSYTGQYPGVTIPMLFGGGNNPDGNNAGIAFPTDGTAEIWKKTNFKYGADITGSLKVSSTFTSSLQQGYTWVGGAGNVSKLVATSSFAGSTINTGSFATTGSNTFNGAQNINGAVTASQGIQSNGSVVVLGGAGIEIKANLQGSGSAYGGITTTVDNTTDPTNVYSSYQLIDQSGNTLIAIAANSYTPQYSGITIPMLFGGGNNPGGDNAGIAFPSNGQMDVWKKSNFKYGTETTGSVNVSGSINAVGTITANNGLVANNSNLNVYGGGISISANPQGSGSAYAIGGGTVDIVTDPTNVYSAWQLVEPGGNNLISIAVNSYTGEYPNTPIPILFGGGNNPNSSNAGIAFPANGQADHWKKSNFKYGVDVTGSVSITETMKLKPQNPLPSGTIGELAVSGSSLYFYNGAWTLVV